jgi:hypothetical protein
MIMPSEPPHHPSRQKSKHAYNDPSLTPVQFMKAVRDDTSVPLVTRLRAAELLLPYEEARKPTVMLRGDKNVTVTIFIDTLFLSPDTVVSYADMLFLKWCCEFENGPLDPNDPETRALWCRLSGHKDPMAPTPGNLADMPPEGNA